MPVARLNATIFAPPFMKSYLALFCLLLLTPLLPAEVVTPQSYNFDGWYPGDPDSFNYTDWEKSKLTDGVAEASVWGGSSSINIDPLVGWFDTSATINVIFSGTVTIDSVTIWAADSNGSAGVWLPTKLNITGPDSFEKSMLITDPAGAGSTVPIVFSGLNFTGDRLTLNLEAVEGGTWIMLSEITFSGPITPVPEPSTYAMLMGVCAMGLGLLRRRSKR